MNIHKNDMNMNTKSMNIHNFFNDNFGLLHALELTKLHHEKIVIEEREDIYI